MGSSPSLSSRASGTSRMDDPLLSQRRKQVILPASSTSWSQSSARSPNTGTKKRGYRPVGLTKPNSFNFSGMLKISGKESAQFLHYNPNIFIGNGTAICVIRHGYRPPIVHYHSS